MKKYLVTISEDVFTTYVVEAEHIDEAEDKALMGEYLSIEDAMSKNSEVISSEEYNENVR